MYRESGGPPRLEVALLECTVGDVACELLEAEFFDDDSLVIVYRLPGQESKCNAGNSLDDRDRNPGTSFYRHCRLQ